jgi:hypothetical protein
MGSPSIVVERAGLPPPAVSKRFGVVKAPPRHLAWVSVDGAEIRLLNGDVFTVDGTLEEVEKKLSDAARSGQSRLAWFREFGTHASVGVNPDHVATLRDSETSN